MTILQITRSRLKNFGVNQKMAVGTKSRKPIRYQRRKEMDKLPNSSNEDDKSENPRREREEANMGAITNRWQKQQQQQKQNSTAAAVTAATVASSAVV